LLAKRGLDPDDRVTITIEPEELIPGACGYCGRAWLGANLVDSGFDHYRSFR
jgi:hypothetical protein